MPYKDYQQHLDYCKRYVNKSREESKQQRVSLERLVLEAVRAKPGELSAASLYQGFNGRFDYAEIKRVIETLSDGLIKVRRGDDRTTDYLWPVPVKEVLLPEGLLTELLTLDPPALGKKPGPAKAKLEKP